MTSQLKGFAGGCDSLNSVLLCYRKLKSPVNAGLMCLQEVGGGADYARLSAGLMFCLFEEKGCC